MSRLTKMPEVWGRRENFLARKMKKERLTTGEANKIIDALLHPLAKGKTKIPVMLLDSMLHACVEQNPKESAKKFVRYTLPKLLEGR